MLAYKKVTKQEVKRMNIVIKIIDGDKIIDYDSLSDKEKKEYGQRLNEQALTSLGYVRKE